MKLNVFGRVVEVQRIGGRWTAYYPGNEGKRRVARDIPIPAHLDPSQIPGYVADLCHEWANDRCRTVDIIEW